MLFGICVLLASCSGKSPKYIIGVSQCSEDIWRNWQNSEMKMEVNFHEDVELRFATAHDDSKLQSQQIGDLIESGIDLLIVAPTNDRRYLQPLTVPTTKVSPSSCLNGRPTPGNIRPSSVPTTMRWVARWVATSSTGSMGKGV